MFQSGQPSLIIDFWPAGSRYEVSWLALSPTAVSSSIPAAAPHASGRLTVPAEAALSSGA